MQYVSLEEVSKKKKEKQFTIVTTHKNVQNYYNQKCTYNAIIHWNLLYALKLWNCLSLQLLFFTKSSWYLLWSDF